MWKNYYLNFLPKVVEDSDEENDRDEDNQEHVKAMKVVKHHLSKL